MAAGPVASVGGACSGFVDSTGLPAPAGSEDGAVVRLFTWGRERKRGASGAGEQSGAMRPRRRRGSVARVGCAGERGCTSRPPLRHLPQAGMAAAPSPARCWRVLVPPWPRPVPLTPADARLSRSLHRAAEVVVPDGALPGRGGVQGPARPLGMELQQRQQSEDDQGMSPGGVRGRSLAGLSPARGKQSPGKCPQRVRRGRGEPRLLQGTCPLLRMHRSSQRVQAGLLSPLRG